VSAQSWTEIAIAVASLVMLALAAITEASAGLVSRSRLRVAAERGARPRSVDGLLDPRRALIAALELAQAIALAAAASLLTTVILREVGRFEHLLAIVVVVLVYLVFGQALPRAIATKQPERTARLEIGLGGVFAFAAAPLVAIGDLFTRFWTGIVPGDGRDAAVFDAEEDLRRAIEGPVDGIIEPEEREMIDAVLELEDTPVRDIMVPRVDIIAVEENQSAAEILATITMAGHSRVPVYRETIDQIVGILYAKDLLPFVIGTTETLPLARLVRPAWVVPESKRIDDLLAELRRNRIHIAIVADEYGGTAGLVTIEDIIETIVGDIQDEYDREAPMLERISGQEVIVDGGIPLSDIEDALDVDLEDDDDDVSTAAGWVHVHLERLPHPGDVFDADGLRCEIISTEGHRLRRLRLTRLDAEGKTTSEHPGPEIPEA
jgi:CBS domain containing-hemolysin-like protein